MKIKMIAALTIATAATVPLAAIANACGGGPETHENREWVTPSGNIVCSVYHDGSGASCQIREHDWAVPASIDGPDGQPCDIASGGLEFAVSKGKPAMLGCYEGASSFDGPALKSLDYGQSHGHGTVSCTSEVSGVTCTDSATGHFFRVSRETYELG
jgi:hypothetical protein